MGSCVCLSFTSGRDVDEAVSAPVDVHRNFLSVGESIDARKLSPSLIDCTWLSGSTCWRWITQSDDLIVSSSILAGATT